jgi:hypothetical protein
MEDGMNEISLSNSREFLDKLAAHVRLLAEPIDFEGLIESGVMRKSGRWYEIKNVHDLPDHVRLKISEIKSQGNLSAVKFSGTARAEKLMKQLKKVGC